MLRRILVFFELITLTYRRLASRPSLTLLSLLGVILAVGLLSSTAFFTQAVDRVLLNEELDELSRVTGRHPFATRIYFFPTSRKPLDMVAAEQAARSIGGTFSSEIGLPIGKQGMNVESPGLMLLPSPDDERYDQNTNSFLQSVTVIYIEEGLPHMEFVSGDPLTEEASDGDVMDVWMHDGLAQEMGVRPGETFGLTVNLSRAPRPIRIRGLWKAKDPENAFWFGNPDTTLKSAFVVSRANYRRFIEPMLPAKSGVVSWFITLDDRRLNPAHAARYADGYTRGMTVIDQYMPGVRLDISALDPLKEFVTRQQSLSLVLLSFNVPALGFLLAFLILISFIVADWQRRETAILVSRGIDMGSILSLTLFESLLLFMIGLPVGIFFGMSLARGMGYTLTFLTFTQREPLPVSLQGINWLLIAIALTVTLLSRLLPTILATRQSVVAQARDYARPVRPPFWQRIYLDFLLILPTYYAYQQLGNRGSLLNVEDGDPNGLFQDPLLILLPALFVLCTSLLSMRIFAIVTRLLDGIATLTTWTTLNLALRQLSRQGRSYINPLLLVTVSLALGIYTYSLAASLDQWLVDRQYYNVGSDVSFLPYIETEDDATLTMLIDVGWMPTVDDYEELPEVTTASRVGRYRTELPVPSGRGIRGHFMAVDRAKFAEVSWFRRDFADESLGSLMNKLALDPSNVLVPRRYLRASSLSIGDNITLKVSLGDGIAVTSNFIIAGVYDYFPTIQEEDTIVIGNLDYIFLLGGTMYSHDIWMRTDESVMEPVDIYKRWEQTGFFKQIERLGIVPARYKHAPTLIAKEQAQFERVGIFGTLSVGFLAATAMAVLALLIYSYASLQDRLYQFGVLRAIGLYQRQVVSQVVLEYSLIIAYGAVGGLIIGAATAQIFIPFLRTAGRTGLPLPPLMPVIARNEIFQLALIFATVMIVIEVGVLARALAGRVFATLRMGHQG
ncbi:MAG: ABC transporter permease [Chloroflexota bacterium]